MLKTWDPDSPSLHQAIICYADILGFRNMSEGALHSGKETEFLQKLKYSLATAYGRLRKLATLGGLISPLFDMKVFTDNIIVAYPFSITSVDRGEPQLGTLLMLFAQVQASLAADGFFLRGAIAAGRHYQDDDIVYGKALLEAVDLDRSGTPPRLVIAPSVEELILEHLSAYGRGWSPYHEDLLEDPKDKRLFINYFQKVFADFPDGPINYDLLKSHSEIVGSSLRKYASDEKVRPKYEWIATYHNYVCQTFADHYLLRKGEEADPEAMARSEEAQRARDHLVPFSAPSEGQLPLRLDEERLRHRRAAIQPSSK